MKPPWLGRWWPAAFLIVGAAWICSQMWHVTWWTSDENIWYPVRVREYLESWHGGVWYARWCPDLYGGYGYPFFNFYAPGVYAAGAALTSLAGTPIESLKILMLLLSMASACGVYGLLRGETERNDAALIGGALFVFLPYRCTDLFLRGDLSEYSAYCLVPFALWAYRAIGRSSGRRAALVATASAALHAAIILTHTIIGFFATEIIGVYFVVNLIRERRAGRRPSIIVAGSTFYALLLSSIYLLPVMFERSLVHLERVTDGRFKAWLNMVDFDQLGDAFFTPGWPIAIAAVAWLAAWAIRRTRVGARASLGWWLAALFLFSLLMPWSAWCWQILPFGEEVQFPWRLYGFIGLFASVGLAIAWRAWFTPRVGLIVALVGAAAMPFTLGRYFELHAERHIPDTVAEIRAENATSTAMDEYLPRSVIDQPPPRSREAWSDDPRVVIDAREVDGMTHMLKIDAPDTAEVSLGVFGFRGWHLRTLAGEPGAHLGIGRDGLLRVRMPHAGHYEVEVHFGSTWLHAIAALFSVLAAVTCYPALRWLCRRAGA